MLQNRFVAALIGMAVAGSVLAAPGVVAAATVRPTLPAQAGSTHFLVHYDPATVSAEYVTSALADFEESYSRLVAGGGGIPNAGLRSPVNDAPRGGDGRTDVYLTAPAWMPPTWSGGMAVSDNVAYPDPLVDSGFLYMTPNMARKAFRFRSAHEFMHVIQYAYIDTAGLFTESTANWAAELALPDVEPGDSQFDTPFLPLDCSYGNWQSQPCGNGYRQWLFFRWLSEHFGDGFVHRLWTVHATSFQISGTTPAIDRQILTQAIANEPGDATLASMYTDYASALWDPTAWITTAVNTLYSQDGPPVATDAGLSRAAPATGPRTVQVDHLATRYVRILQADASAPGDRVRVRVTPGLGAAPPRLLSATGPGRARSVTMLSATGGGAYEATVSLDGASVADVVLPLTNDTATDNLTFTYSAELLPAGGATPPSNDLRDNPMRIQPRTTTVLDIAYAGGLGSTEAPDCGPTSRSRGGVWFVVLVDQGPFTIDAQGSDFDPAVAVYDVSIPGQPYLWGCSKHVDRGLVTGETYAREYLIYVGRAASSGPGHTLRLTVDAVPNDFGQDQVSTRPKVTRLSITPKRFKPMAKGRAVVDDGKGRGGARLAFTLNVAATMRFDIQQRTTGRKAGRGCVKTTPANRGKRKCTRYVRVAGVGIRGVQSGATTLRLTGRRSAAKALPAGTYRLGVRAIDAQGLRSRRVTAAFGIKG